MIVHVAMYQLTDSSHLDFVKNELEKLSNCKLIKRNQVHLTCLPNVSNASSPLFAEIIHIAYFKDSGDSQEYPLSNEHVSLVKATNAYIKQIMTIDYVDENGDLI